MKRLVCSLVIVAVMAGCMVRPQSGAVGSGQSGVASNGAQGAAFGEPPGRGGVPGGVPAIEGSVGPAGGYHVQLTDLLNDFAKGATVSLIEVESGETQGTSLADASGSFVIEFGSSFLPKKKLESDPRSVAFYLEAVRGVKGANSLPNQAGADAIRLRTMIWFDFASNGWVSLSNALPGSLRISTSTTTVSFFVNQKVVNKETVSAEAFIGSLDPTKAPPSDYTAIGELTAGIYDNLQKQVSNAVTKDQDPIHTLILTSGGQTVNTSTNVQISGITPTAATIGTVLTITGQNFEPAVVEVWFVGSQGYVDVANSTKNVLKVPVPAGARSGLIRVSINGKNAYSPPLTVTTNDGHLTTYTDSNNATSLFAVSNDLGSLVRINPDGSTTTLNSSLSAPRAVLVNPEGAINGTYRVYVADGGTNKIAQLSQAGTVANAAWLSATDPSSLVLGPDGDLYVAQTSAGTVLRARVNWSTGAVTNAAVATYTGFSSPVELAFDFGGNLYVAENSMGRVRRFKPGASDTASVAPATTDWGVVTDPDGIAIDTGGNAFVTSSTNNIVFKIDSLRNMSAFLTVAGAGSIARDPAGNLYVADQSRNLIRRVTLGGDQKIVAYGLASLRGVAVDANGNVYTALQNSGAVLKLSADGITTAPILSGIAAPYGLTLRNDKIYVAHTDTQNVTEVSLTGAARSVIPGGLHSPGGVEVSDDGSTYYAGRLNLGDSWWLVVPTGGSPFDQSGIDVVTGGGMTVTQRYPLIHGTNAWNSFGQSLVKMSGTQFAVADITQRKVVLMTDKAGGSYSQRIQDITPVFAGSKQFPDQIYDMAYDGTRYLFVSCNDKKIYRIDTTNYGAAAGVITGMPGQPYGLTYMGGTLYAVDRGSKTVRRVSSPGTATTIDAWTVDLGAAGAGDLMGVTYFGTNLFVSDYGGAKIWKVTPPATTGSVYITMNANPSRIGAWNDGRLLVRCSDGVYYNISTAATPVESQYTSTIGCTGCGIIDFAIDASSNIFWSQPMQHQTHNARGLLNTRELARDQSWLYIAATHGVVGMDLTSGEELSINNVGTAYGLAVNSTTRDLYVLNSGGGLYVVDYATRGVTGKLTLPTSTGWGLDFDAPRNVLYAVAPGNSLVYKVPTSTWTATPVKVGLHAPMF